VHISSLSVDGFRNLECQEVELAKGINVLTGENGQGKTNFLESIYLLATLKSFRTSHTKDVVCFGKQQAEVKGILLDNGIQKILRTSIGEKGRNAWLGEKAVFKTKEYLRQLFVIAFTPDDMSMVHGPPSTRRKFLDRLSFFFNPGHFNLVLEYRKILQNRNFLLREKKVLDKALFDSLTEMLAEIGSKLFLSRKMAFEKMCQSTETFYRQMEGNEKAVSLVLLPGWNVIKGKEKDSLFKQLKESEERDQARKITTLGPQQDDFEFLINGFLAKRHSSQGQKRSLVLNLLFSIVNCLIVEKKEKPVLLLDDISSELDTPHRIKLMEQIQKLDCQTLLTTTEENVVSKIIKKDSLHFLVSKGKIQKASKNLESID
jgi:DNA replication and repair protein RecF